MLFGVAHPVIPSSFGLTRRAATGPAAGWTAVSFASAGVGAVAASVDALGATSGPRVGDLTVDGLASVAVLATLATAGLLSVVMAALAKPTDFGLDNSLTLVAAILNGAFGGDLVAHLRLSGESAQASLGAVPLTVTVVSLAIAVLAFRRVTATYTSAVDALLASGALAQTA